MRRTFMLRVLAAGAVLGAGVLPGRLPSAAAAPSACVGGWVSVLGGAPVTKQVPVGGSCPALPSSDLLHPCPGWQVNAGPSADVTVGSTPVVRVSTEACATGVL